MKSRCIKNVSIYKQPDRQQPYVGNFIGDAPIAMQALLAPSHVFFSLKILMQSPAIGYQWWGQETGTHNSYSINTYSVIGVLILISMKRIMVAMIAIVAMVIRNRMIYLWR